MTVDHSKLAVWLVLFAALGAGLLFRHEKPAPRPEPAPIKVTIPDLPKPEPEVKVIVVPVPTQQLDQKPAAPVVKAPVQKKQVTPKAKPKPAKAVKPADPCARVPAKAYQYPHAAVIAAAEARGIPAEAIVILKKCIGAS